MTARTEDLIARTIALAVALAILVGLGYLFATAWVKEDVARVKKLNRHFYDVALRTSPAAPTGVRPNYGELSTPKTKVFQDSSIKSEVIEKQNERKREGLR